MVLDHKFESVYYIDPQQVKSKCCPRCRREVYPPGYSCSICEDDAYDPA